MRFRLRRSCGAGEATGNSESGSNEFELQGLIRSVGHDRVVKARESGANELLRWFKVVISLVMATCKGATNS